MQSAHQPRSVSQTVMLRQVLQVVIRSNGVLLRKRMPAVTTKETLSGGDLARMIVRVGIEKNE